MQIHSLLANALFILTRWLSSSFISIKFMLTNLFIESRYCFNNLFSLLNVIILILNDGFLILKNWVPISKLPTWEVMKIPPFLCLKASFTSSNPLKLKTNLLFRPVDIAILSINVCPRI